MELCGCGGVSYTNVQGGAPQVSSKESLASLGGGVLLSGRQEVEISGFRVPLSGFLGFRLKFRAWILFHLQVSLRLPKPEDAGKACFPNRPPRPFRIWTISLSSPLISH